MIIWGSAAAVRITNPESLPSERFEYFSDPQKALPLKTGDVLKSKSGNYRMVLSEFSSSESRVITFLSLIGGREIKIQSALEENIEWGKIEQVTRRADCQPLYNFQHEIRQVSSDHVVVKNLALLLGLGTEGKIWQRIILTRQPDAFGYTQVAAFLNEQGELAEYSIPEPYPEKERIDFHILKSNNNSEEYIRKLLIYDKELRLSVKRNLILSVVLCNIFKSAL